MSSVTESLLGICFSTLFSRLIYWVLHAKIFFLIISMVEYSMLSDLNVWMLYQFAYHGLDNLSQWQLLVVFVHLCLCALSPYCCTYHFVLQCFAGSWVGTAISPICVEILKFCLHWILLTFTLCGIVVWFFAVGLFSCRCLVDLPGVKTLWLTNQQHQLPKGLVYHLRLLKTPMRKGSDFLSTHTSTQTCLTSRPL